MTSATPFDGALHILSPCHSDMRALDALQDFYHAHAVGTGLLLARVASAAHDVQIGKATAIVIMDRGEIVAASLGYLHDNGTYEIGSVLVHPDHAGKGYYKAMRAAHRGEAGCRPVLLFSRCAGKLAAEGFREMKPWDPLFVLNLAHKATRGQAPTPSKARLGFKAAIGTGLAFTNDNDECDRSHRDIHSARPVPLPG